MEDGKRSVPERTPAVEGRTRPSASYAALVSDLGLLSAFLAAPFFEPSELSDEKSFDLMSLIANPDPSAFPRPLFGHCGSADIQGPQVPPLPRHSGL